MKKKLFRLGALCCVAAMTITTGAQALSVEEAYDILQRSYVDKLPRAAQDAKSLDELFSYTDDYTYYMTAEEYRAELEDEGYDGLIVEDQEFGGKSYVAFKPNQIKSATNNVGTFADICYFVSLRCNGLQAAQQHPKHHRLSMPCANCGGAERR